jgi:hypothetical protein
MLITYNVEKRGAQPPLVLFVPLCNCLYLLIPACLLTCSVYTCSHGFCFFIPSGSPIEAAYTGCMIIATLSCLATLAFALAFGLDQLTGGICKRAARERRLHGLLRLTNDAAQHNLNIAPHHARRIRLLAMQRE